MNLTERLETITKQAEAVDKGVKASREHAKFAVERAQAGQKYGDDMKSSAVICYNDAISLLQKAIKELKE